MTAQSSKEPGAVASWQAQQSAWPQTTDAASGVPSSGTRAALRGKILVVDDDASIRHAVAASLRAEGHTVKVANVFKALAKLEEFSPDVLVTDLAMPALEGIDLMRKARELDAEVAMIVVTAQNRVDIAVKAMREGALDCLSKPIDFDDLPLVIGRALERRRLRRVLSLPPERLENQGSEGMIGKSLALQKTIQTIEQVAPSRASVLLTGESGTGKELVAAAIHRRSPRASAPFVKLHCAALAETLLESELFGHDKGAFTGAVVRRGGRFQQADGGTLFLDEIGEISPAIQSKLLRFLQEREFERVGSNETVKVDVRVVAATNRSLRQMVTQGSFREDLFYRLNVVSIELPPLRARRADIPLLAMHFLRAYAAQNGKGDRRLSDAALERLCSYDWPGNIRELQNAIEAAVVVAGDEEVQVEDLPPDIRYGSRARDAVPRIPGASLADLERYAILETLKSTGGETARAARILGISPRTIQYRLHEYRASSRGSTAR